MTNGLAFLPSMVMKPLADIAAMTSQKNYELRVELTHTDNSVSFDNYGYFTLTTSQYNFNAFFKKSSSPNLAAFDLG